MAGSCKRRNEIEDLVVAREVRWSEGCEANAKYEAARDVRAFLSLAARPNNGSLMSSIEYQQLQQLQQSLDHSMN